MIDTGAILRRQKMTLIGFLLLTVGVAPYSLWLILFPTPQFLNPVKTSTSRLEGAKTLVRPRRGRHRALRHRQAFRTACSAKATGRPGDALQLLCRHVADPVSLARARNRCHLRELDAARDHARAPCQPCSKFSKPMRGSGPTDTGRKHWPVSFVTRTTARRPITISTSR